MSHCRKRCGWFSGPNLPSNRTESVPTAMLRPMYRWMGHLKTRVWEKMREGWMLKSFWSQKKLHTGLPWNILIIPSLLLTSAEAEEGRQFEKNYTLKYWDVSVRHLVFETRNMLESKNNNKYLINAFTGIFFSYKSALPEVFLNKSVGFWLPWRLGELTICILPRTSSPPYSLQTMRCFRKNRSQIVFDEMKVFMFWDFF